MPKKKSVFISYSSIDNPLVEVFEALLKESPFLEPLIVVKERSVGTALTKKVADAIGNAAFFAPILTEASYKTQWINQEIGYASALGRINFIFPIVEAKILPLLNGFIHKEIDIYKFDRNANETTEADNLTKPCKELVHDITKLVRPPASKALKVMTDIFHGIWVNQNKRPNNRTDAEFFEVRNDNQYFINNKHVFTLTDIYISEDGRIVHFRKVGAQIENLNVSAFNELEKQPDGSYRGWEEDVIEIVYSKGIISGTTRRPPDPKFTT